MATDHFSLIAPLLITGTGMGFTFAPMTAAAMAQVPPRIAGSASGILNTTRNLGQVLGIAVLGSVLQGRLSIHGTEALATLPGLDPHTGAAVGALIASGRVEAIAAAVPPEAAALLPAIYGVVKTAFVSSLHETFAIGAATCLARAAIALLIQNPSRQAIRAERRLPEAVAQPAAAD